MKTYEIAFIISSQLNSKETEAIVSDIENEIKNTEGIVLHSQRNEARTLSHLMKKQSSGYFVVIECQIPENMVEQIQARLKKEPGILRHLIFLKEPPRKRREKRTRRPFGSMPIEYATASNPFKEKEQTNQEPEPKTVDNDALDKKLDEILSE